MQNNEIYNECLNRLEMLKISRQCINAFKRGELWLSEGIGALYELNKEEKEIVSNFENEHKGYKVYHIIHNITDFGELYNLLYVSNDKEEWEQDREDIKEGYMFCYVYNKDLDYCSEFGTIAIKSNIGGLVRIG